MPVIELVGDDVAARIDPGAHVDRHAHGVVVPAVLVPAHVLKTNRLADFLRQNGSGMGGIDPWGAAIGAAAFVVDDSDVGGRQTGHLRERGLVAGSSLARTEEDRTGWPHV